MTTQRTILSSKINTLILLVIMFTSPLFGEITYQSINIKSGDGASIYAYHFDSKAPTTKSTIVLFHQAGASALGEYGDIIPTLQNLGSEVLAIDLRSGGNQFGGDNKTVASHANKKFGYCDAYIDVEAAIDYAYKHFKSPILIWGSSYSAALVIQAGAKNPKTVSGILSFSPASGKNLSSCLPEQYIDAVKVPLIAFRPDREMQYPSVQKQAELFKSKGIPYYSIDNGVHGSSMLVESRTKHDTSQAWNIVKEFLKTIK